MDNTTATPTQGEGQSQNQAGQGPADPKAAQTSTQTADSTTGKSAEKTPEQILAKKIQELERDNKKYRDERKAMDEAKAKAEEDSAKAKGEWETLAKKHENELSLLRPSAEQLKSENERYKGVVQTLLEQQTAGLTHEQKGAFEALFGDIEQPEIKLNKLATWLSMSGQTTNGTGTGNSGKPASQAKDDPKIKALDWAILYGTRAEKNQAIAEKDKLMRAQG